MTREQQIAASILQYVGGKENITRVAHCMTRVRVSLRDPGKANIDSLKQIEGVMGVIEDETLQIVVGPGVVNKVAAALCELTGLELGEVIEDGIEDIAERTKAEVKARQQTPLKRLLRKIGSIFIPLIPGLVASGIINGIANFAKNAGVDPQTTWLQLLLLIGGGIFASLGVLVGYNTAKEFGGTPVLGAIAGILVFNPAMGDIKLFGEALTPGRGGLFAVLLAAWLMAVVEKRVRSFVPNAVDIIVTPLITVLIVCLFTLIAVQPLAGWLSLAITSGLKAVLDIGGVVAGAVLAGTFLPLVMVGLHHGLTPIHMELIQKLGSTPLLPVLAMAGAGQVGAAIAVYVKTKNKRLRNIIKGALPVGFLGIGEPLLYGVTLPLGRPFVTACLGAAVGGAFQAVMKTAALGIGVSGLSLIPLIADTKYVIYFIGLVISYTFGFLFTYWFGFKEEMAAHI
ncbi:PTS transporter subunit EIIC [Geobacillus thermodenitrificans]|jgi:sucrose PTS system EIIBCA or EIIBC component|uniref:PTS system, sucrose-specific IIBC component n=1 Tax=Geobacillus thermodenitrificans (strain NG80-2) TaxID=420246 RepID=A4IPI1_GEOTN|nr:MULTISPECIES: PTS transporter subunit EIIC [Geobacillus]ABO67235.1 PTS system, sucrose-specific IIBC component [Geobacillus thermodenitrificans NG80-2]ARP43030.1 Permease IIC component [Geobacillus thermodenitrificans]ATO38911.1 PTS sugar transporter subunit IIC [Geobacillus thermodenitrificans]MEC5186938.1 PTS system sucrose-specific IIC component [Geobacillus thermodenitrificans]MED3717279.1 PTS transporter subunit EIIC [Geobacillus thermodenitrificans]